MVAAALCNERAAAQNHETRLFNAESAYNFGLCDAPREAMPKKQVRT
jgi:hypothetical protein